MRLIHFAAIGAFGTSKEGAANRDSAATDSASGMAAMPEMQWTIGAGMMDSMQAHMRMTDGMTPEQMKASLPAHRKMVANMLSQMNADMRTMNMPADAAWNAAVDSVRQDLVRMPEMSAQELKEMMPARHARVTRLMEMHQRMMGSMTKKP